MSSTTTSDVPSPLHPSILPRLDPEYAAFHTEHLLNFVSPHLLPWSPAIRDRPAVPGASPPLAVGKTQDYPLSKTNVRVFTPTGDKPEKGWPAFIFFHGGGWTLGGIGSEATFSTNMCQRAKCVVISVDYRLAPEHPYPAAVEDAVESLEWVYHKGKELLHVDTSRIAIGGSSSGGNLAAIVALKAPNLSPPIPIVFQLLIVPVTDNTATHHADTSQPSWHENALTPWLSPERMYWFKNNYLPNEADWKKVDASPWFASDQELSKVQGSVWVGVGELDILRDEGVRYGERFRALGKDVEIQVYKGAPHPIMAMDGVLKVGKQMITDAAEALAKAVGTSA